MHPPASQVLDPPTAAQVNYPLPIRELIRSHGLERVQQIGSDALGYPLSWAATGGEFITVVRAMGEAARKDGDR